jgi:ABC-type Fe3+-siderophore transport system permease subunit
MRITVADVAKFAHVPGLKAVYHHGPVTIYDTSGLGVVPKRAGFTGFHQMGLGPWDALLGAGVVVLILLIGRRLTWVKSAARDIGVLATTLAVIAVTIFIGGILLDLHLMPGPAFTLGAFATSIVILAARRRMDGLRPVRRLPLPHTLEPLVLLGVAAAEAGLALAIYAAWITNVADVSTILRAASGI